MIMLWMAATIRLLQLQGRFLQKSPTKIGLLSTNSGTIYCESSYCQS